MYNANSGYNGWSMSQRAAEAYEDGEMPRSKWTKKAMVAAIRAYCDENDLVYDDRYESLRKDELFARFFEWTSWHHTSKFFNETDFYSIDEGEVKDAFRPMTEEEVADRDAARKQAIEAEHAKRLAAKASLAKMQARHDNYLAANGFRPDTVAAFAHEHPECCHERVSRKGNRVLNYIDYHGDEQCCPVDRATQTHLYGFDATEPGSFDRAIKKYLDKTKSVGVSLAGEAKDMRRSCAELAGSADRTGIAQETR